MHSMITAIFVEALQGPQHALRFSLLKKWKEELFAVIEPKEHSWWCYEPGDDGMYTRYYQTGSKLREIDSTAKGQKMVSSSFFRQDSETPVDKRVRNRLYLSPNASWEGLRERSRSTTVVPSIG